MTREWQATASLHSPCTSHDNNGYVYTVYINWERTTQRTKLLLATLTPLRTLNWLNCSGLQDCQQCFSVFSTQDSYSGIDKIKYKFKLYYGMVCFHIIKYNLYLQTVIVSTF